MNGYKNKDDFINKQIKGCIAKAQGAINLIDDNAASHFIRNKLLGINQKLIYMLKTHANWEKNEKDNDSDISTG